MDPGVVEEAGDGQVEGGDLQSGVPGAGDVGEVGDERDRPASAPADLLLHAVEFVGAPADEHDGAVLRQPSTVLRPTPEVGPVMIQARVADASSVCGISSAYAFGCVGSGYVTIRQIASKAMQLLASAWFGSRSMASTVASATADVIASRKLRWACRIGPLVRLRSSSCAMRLTAELAVRWLSVVISPDTSSCAGCYEHL